MVLNVFQKQYFHTSEQFIFLSDLKYVRYEVRVLKSLFWVTQPLFLLLIARTLSLLDLLSVCSDSENVMVHRLTAECN